MAGYIGSKAVTLSTTAADVTGDATINGNLTVNGTTITVDSAAAQEIRLGDNDKMTFGDATGGDLQIYHNGTTNYLYALADININANTGVNIQAKNGEESIVAEADGAVTLYYDNAAKLATTSTGISVTGNANFADNGKAIFGAGSDLQIYHDGATGHSIITESGGGALQLRGENLILEHPTTGNNYLLGVDGASGYVKLYHNGSEKLATTSSGVDITGTLTSDGLTVDGTSQFDNYSSTSGKGRIRFGNSGQQYIEGYDTGNAGSGSYLSFGQSTSEHARIDNSGRLLVGKTSFGLSSDGVQLGPTNSGFTADNNIPVYINRKTNDGGLLSFQKDGTAVGSIGIAGGDLYISGGSSHAGIRFDTNILTPAVNGTQTDATVDLGYSSYRFKDLYLGGGVVETTTTVTYAASIALTYNNGSIQTVTLTGNVTFTDSLADGESIVLMLNAGSSYTVTFPTMTWVTSSGNAAPTLTANDTIVFWKIGSTLYGAYAGSYT